MHGIWLGGPEDLVYGQVDGPWDANAVSLVPGLLNIVSKVWL